MELELKKECLDTYELGEPQTLTQEETAETIVPDYCPGTSPGSFRRREWSASTAAQSRTASPAPSG